MTEDDPQEPEDGSTAEDTESAVTDAATEGEEIDVETDPDTEAEPESSESESSGARDRLEASADRAVSELDSRLIDILSWVLDTETRGRIYVYLRQEPWSTSDEVAEGTGLYPSTVREALAELSEEEIVDRRKRDSEGAGNNPYEYKSIAPSELVGSVVGRVQEELNTVFTMDRRGEDGEEPVAEPVQIEVNEASGEKEE